MRLILLLLAAQFFSACDKDCPTGPSNPGPPEPEEPCEPLPLPGGWNGWDYLLPEHVLKSARFNPDNGNELIFTESSPAGSGHTILWKYQISSTTMTSILLESELEGMGTAIWGSNGWILVDGISPEGLNIYKVLANGDSLTQLSYSGSNTHPHWSPSCASYGYSHQDGSQWMAVVVSTSTGVSDTLYQVPINENSCWYEENLVAHASNLGIITGDIATDQWTITGETPVPPESTEYDYYGMTATGNNLVWTHKSGLYSTDLVTGAGNLLTSTCDSRYFSGLDYSPQTNKLLSIRRLRTPLDSVTLLVENELVLMNPDGTGLQVLNLPFPE